MEALQSTRKVQPKYLCMWTQSDCLPAYYVHPTLPACLVQPNLISMDRAKLHR